MPSNANGTAAVPMPSARSNAPRAQRPSELVPVPRAQVHKSQETLVPCGTCGKEFRGLRGLTMHVVAAHPGNVEESMRAAVATQSSLPVDRDEAADPVQEAEDSDEEALVAPGRRGASSRGSHDLKEKVRTHFLTCAYCCAALCL